MATHGRSVYVGTFEGKIREFIAKDETMEAGFTVDLNTVLVRRAIKERSESEKKTDYFDFNMIVDVCSVLL